MYIVAVTRWGSGLDEQIGQLATRLGVFAYDLRMRLNGPLPVIVTRVEQSAEASELMQQLRAWGHGAIGCDMAKVPSLSSMHQPRKFVFAGDRLQTEGLTQERAELGADEVYALIHAMVLSEQQITQEKTSKKFSASRAVLTGGMAMTRKSTKTTRATESESEERIYLIRRGFTQPMVFCQHQLHYTGLGDAMGYSSHESFAALTTRLREFCPQAIYDEQLRRSRRKSSVEAVSSMQAGKSKTSSVVHSNASGVDLAAYLILVAHARGQI